jgi:hypothetical protein
VTSVFVKSGFEKMFWLPSLMLEAGDVISKRLWIISKGGKRAARESRRMVTEKMLAAAEAGVILGTGGSPDKVMQNYRKRVRANARRLK